MSRRRAGLASVGNLPAEVTSFVGRADELGHARRTLSESRLVTMTGAGGVGKTRFALRLAADVAHMFPDGVWFVELANLLPTASLSSVEQAVAEVLGLGDFSMQGPLRALVEHLTDRHCLLVLDNCEHLATQSASLVSRLLRATAKVRILVTSRRALGCPGEHTIAVAPLGLPDASAPSGGEALELFGQRASALGVPLTPANMTAATEICRRLDGLPLAIELAVGRLLTLSVEEVLERLEDRFGLLTVGVRPGPPTHQTLRGVVEWSYHLCTEPEQLLWQRASVFAGGFDLDAAEEVCADSSIARDEVHDLLTGLVRQSLLTVERGGVRARYRFLETLREYGAWRLARHGCQAAFQRRHRDHYRQLAATAAEDWFSPRESRWLRWARTEMPNLRAALQYGLSHSEPEHSLEIAINLTRLRIWLFTGWPGEGRAWLDHGLAHPGLELTGDETVAALRLAATALAGWLALHQGDLPAAQENLRICEGLPCEDTFGTASFLEAAHALLVESDERSVEMFTRVLDRMRVAGAPVADMATVRTVRAMAASFLADPATALSITQRHRDDSIQHQVDWQLSWVNWAVGLALSRNGDHRAGLRMARESLRGQRDVGDQWGTVWGTHVLAWIKAAELRDRLDRGEAPDTPAAEDLARTLGGADRLRRWTGVILAERGPFGISTASAAQVARTVLGEHAYLGAFERGSFSELRRAEAYPRILEMVLGERGQASVPGPPSVDTSQRLTKREEEIAALMAKGGTNAEIAQRLVLSIRTVQTHVGNMLRKRDLRNRQELVAWYLREH